MKTALALAVALSVSACGDDDGGGSWPTVLYLAPLDSELSLQLVELKPGNF
jgi:hypothetical protein